LKKIT